MANLPWETVGILFFMLGLVAGLGFFHSELLRTLLFDTRRKQWGILLQIIGILITAICLGVLTHSIGVVVIFPILAAIALLRREEARHHDTDNMGD